MSVFLNTLYVTTVDAYLRLEGETVCVMVEKEKRLQVPLHHLGAFVRPFWRLHDEPGPYGPLCPRRTLCGLGEPNR